MGVTDRQNKLINILKKSDEPVSGSKLSSMLKVSRQIIVSDISKIKESGVHVYSTPKGYTIDKDRRAKTIYKVHHSGEDTEKELNLFVDMGAEVEDVFISHRVYNEIHAKLCISSRKDVRDFCEDIKSGRSSLLTSATNGFHYHTVSAPDEETLDKIYEALKNEGFLCEFTDYEPEGLYIPPKDTK